MIKVKHNKLQWLWIITPIIAVALFGLANFFKDNINQSEQSVNNFETGAISKEDAVAKVKELPEVVDYLKRVPNGQVLVNGEDNNRYMVQVYEAKDGHTATFNWYNVDKTTGEVKKEF